MFFKKKSMPPDNGTKASFLKQVELEFLIHELKDPISVVETGTRTLLARGTNLDEKQEKLLKRILKNIIKTREMVNGLLEVGQAEASCFHPVLFNPVRAVFASIIEAIEVFSPELWEKLEPAREKETELVRLMSENGIYFFISPETIETEMWQDREKFCRIVGNLVKNALFHTKKRIEIKLSQEGERLFVEVSDDGPGIASKHHEMVFERYAQVKACVSVTRKGHGIGLAGARVMARCLGGDIRIKSEKNSGASFILALPVRMREKEEERRKFHEPSGILP